MQKTYLSHARVGIWMAIKNEEISEDFNVLLQTTSVKVFQII